MNENDPREAAADPPSDHETPNGQPGDRDDFSQESQSTETTVETPGGTTVTEEAPAE